jgi:hypothetical protein
MLDKLSLEDLAPVRSRSAPGSGGAKSSESVVGGVGRGVLEAFGSDTFGRSTVEEGEGEGACEWVLPEPGVVAVVPFAAFLGCFGPDFAENERGI